MGSSKPASRGVLAVMMNGAFLGEVEARALWVEFSAYMDAHRNDFDGFAKAKGYDSVKPEHRQGRAVLVIVRK